MFNLGESFLNEYGGNGIADIFCRQQLHVLWELYVIFAMRRYNAALESKPCKLLQALIDRRNGSNFSCESDFADRGKIFPDRLVPQTGRNGQRDGKVRRGLVQLQTADNIYIGISRLKSTPFAVRRD